MALQLPQSAQDQLAALRAAHIRGEMTDAAFFARAQRITAAAIREMRKARKAAKLTR